MKFISIKHTFGMGQTVEAAIRLHHNNVQITREDMDDLIIEYNKLNDSKVPKLGDSVWIPINKNYL